MQAQGAVRVAGELTPLVRLFRANWRPVLAGYEEYTQRVRYRLVPRVW